MNQIITKYGVIMKYLNEFYATVGEITSDYDDGEITYFEANTQMETAIETLRGHFPADVPDDILEECFTAYSELQVLAFDLGDVLEGEACKLIEDRASDDLSYNRSPEDVLALWEPYIKRIEGIANGTETYQILDHKALQDIADIEHLNLN